METININEFVDNYYSSNKNTLQKNFTNMTVREFRFFIMQDIAQKTGITITDENIFNIAVKIMNTCNIYCIG